MKYFVVFFLSIFLFACCRPECECVEVRLDAAGNVISSQTYRTVTSEDDCSDLNLNIIDPSDGGQLIQACENIR